MTLHTFTMLKNVSTAIKNKNERKYKWQIVTYEPFNNFYLLQQLTSSNFQIEISKLIYFLIDDAYKNRVGVDATII